MRNIWALIQLVSFLLLSASIVVAALTYRMIGIAGIIAATISSIGSILLFIFSGIKYRQETKKIREEGENIHNPLL